MRLMKIQDGESAPVFLVTLLVGALGCGRGVAVAQHSGIEEPFVVEVDLANAQPGDDSCVLTDAVASGTGLEPAPWPGGIIPFAWEDRLWKMETIRVDLYKAMDAWMSAGANVTFIYRTNESEFVKLQVSQAPGGGNGVGPEVGAGARFLNVNPDNFATWRPPHELGHVLGFYHEFQRSDRDEWLFVQNTDSEQFTRKAFYQATDFDFASVMMYWECANSNCGNEWYCPDESHRCDGHCSWGDNVGCMSDNSVRCAIGNGVCKSCPNDDECEYGGRTLVVRDWPDPGPCHSETSCRELFGSAPANNSSNLSTWDKADLRGLYGARSARPYYVAPWGNDAADGRIFRAKLTVRSAYEDISSGGTIWIDDGEYVGVGYTFNLSKSVTLRAHGGSARLNGG